MDYAGDEVYNAENGGFHVANGVYDDNNFFGDMERVSNGVYNARNGVYDGDNDNNDNDNENNNNNNNDNSIITTTQEQ